MPDSDAKSHISHAARFRRRFQHPHDQGAIYIEQEKTRIPFAHRMPDNVRNHFVAICGEFVGTVLFLFFALGGTQVANNIPSSSGLSVEVTGSNPQQLQYIALCFGFSLAVNAWIFFRISGGLFNPAVTVGMFLIGALPPVRAILLFFTQILGGITASGLISAMLPGPLTVQTKLGGGTSVVQGLFLEMMLTATLVFAIFMMAAEKHRATFIAPVGIGLALFVAELVGVYFTGGSLNPARSFGPALVDIDFPTYHWIYWIGPMLGSCLAAAFYKFIKALEYETANPDQDAAAQYYDEDGKSRPNTARSVKHHSLTHQISPGAYSERTKVGFARPSDDFGVTADPAMMSEQSFVPQTPSPMTPARYSQDRVQPATYLSTDGQTLTADGCVRKLGRGSSYAV